ncbi:flagellar protein FlaG [Thiobacter aerophilum]|uniref:Flagellar protein FlaG n=1 Tax=Thiobacter aerophilum TaxID=3121275 RepID=A0ABV0EAW6_9BURK
MSNGSISPLGPGMRMGGVSGAAPNVSPETPPPMPPPATTLLLPAPGQRQQADAQVVKQAVERINAFIQSAQSDLKISVDQDTGMVVVKVVDRESGEVIRQIPPEEALTIAKHLDSAQGVLFRSKV